MSDMTSIRSIKRSRSRRVLAASAGFALIAALCYCLILGQGAVKLSPMEVIEVLTGGGTQQAINVVWDLRLPVAIATVLVLSLIHISEPTRRLRGSRMPSSA